MFCGGDFLYREGGVPEALRSMREKMQAEREALVMILVGLLHFFLVHSEVEQSIAFVEARTHGSMYLFMGM